MTCLRIGLAVAITTILFGPFGGLFRPTVTVLNNYSSGTVQVGGPVDVGASRVRFRVEWN